MKYITYEIENYKYPYAVRIHFSHSQKEIDDVHFKLEYEYTFRRLGNEFHFETEDERQQFTGRLGN